MSASVSELSTPSNSAANKWPRLSARKQFKDDILFFTSFMGTGGVRPYWNLLVKIQKVYYK